MTIKRVEGEIKDYGVYYEVEFTKETFEDDCRFLNEVQQYERVDKFTVGHGIAVAKVYVDSSAVIRHLEDGFGG